MVPSKALLHRWQSLLSILLLPALLATAAAATGELSAAPAQESQPRIQAINGRIANGGLQFYRVSGLRQGQTLHVHARATSGHLDPLVALLRPDVKLDELERGPLEQLIESLSRASDPIDVTRQILEKYALAGNDDFAGRYAAAFSAEIPRDGDYWLAIGSSLVRDSVGTFRLLVGIDQPDVLSGHPQGSGAEFVFAERDLSEQEPGIVSVSGELGKSHGLQFYNLSDLAAGQTLHVRADATEGNLRPVLTLYDFSDKPVAFGNFSGSQATASIAYTLPAKAENYRLMIAGSAASGEGTAGKYRLLIGVNSPQVLNGEGETSGRDLLREGIPVGIGVKLQQITSVDQKAENYGVVATLVMRWRDPALAFDPEMAQDRYKVYMGDAFGAEMNRQGLRWPQFTIVNQQGNRWVQNRVVVIWPDGNAIYLERFSTTLQAPDFDFRDFPFDQQRFFMHVDLLFPEWTFQFRELDGFSEVGDQLGEEEWVITSFKTELAKADLLGRPVSRFNFEFNAERHLEYYIFRIQLPLAIIIAVSWVLFFLKDYSKRVDVAGANLLLFIAFNFTISNDLPRLGYLTFLDTLLISAFLVTGVVLILSVYLRRQDMIGRNALLERIDRYVLIFYPLAYVATMGAVTLLFR